VNPEQLIAHFKRLSAALTTTQLISLAGAFLGVVGVVVGSAYWINEPSYALLFSDLDAESASAAVTRLKTSKVAYVLDEGGRTIRVAADRVDEMRLEFASQGLPTTGRIGFEIFDRTAFGTTEFLEHVNYRRALEGELARTISTISEVASARVHIAMAKDTLFASDHQAAKASVVLKLRTNKPLAPSTAIGITGLIAASVESLTPEAVVILDTFGRSLSKPADDGNEPNSGQQLDRQRRVEHDLSAKVMSLLEPVMGPGHVRVNVTARLNSNSEEETEEHWDPATVVRSRQTSTDTGGALMAAGGVAGARANIPPAATPTGAAPAPLTPPPPAGAPAMASRSAETTNYEVSKTTRHRIAPPGQIARLTVAVVLDDERVASKAAGGAMTMTAKPRTPTDLQRIQHLVASAVGIDTERGDEVTVENIAFGENENPAGEEGPASGLWQRMSPQLIGTSGLVMQIGRLAAIVGIAALAFFMILRPIGQRALRLPAAPMKGPTTLMAGQPQPGLKTVGDLEDEMEAALALGKPTGARRLPVLTRLLDKTAEQQPEHVARLVRGWLTEEEAG
jgi:flagellar M-ring protein FliF